MQPLLTTRELLAYLKIHRSTLYKYLELGMPVHRFPGGLRFNLADVLAWAADRDAKARAARTDTAREGRADEA